MHKKFRKIFAIFSICFLVTGPIIHSPFVQEPVRVSAKSKAVYQRLTPQRRDFYRKKGYSQAFAKRKGAFKYNFVKIYKKKITFLKHLAE